MGILLRNGIHFLQNSVQFAKTLSEVSDEEKLDCDTPGLTEQRCISLLKSKSGFLLRKRIFRFFTKSKNGLLIQMIHNGGGFFGSYPKPDTLDT